MNRDETRRLYEHHSRRSFVDAPPLDLFITFVRPDMSRHRVSELPDIFMKPTSAMARTAMVMTITIETQVIPRLLEAVPVVGQ